ncbi:MAG: hypothetical protein ACT4NX_06525 [Deltaproteobacteria bacterium]
MIKGENVQRNSFAPSDGAVFTERDRGEKRGEIADLDLATIIALTGIPPQRGIVNPKNPGEMAKKVKVTFRPLSNKYENKTILRFYRRLEEKLKALGVEVVDWNQAAELDSDGLIAKILRMRKVKSSIDAVIDVDRPYSLFRKIMSRLAERIYTYLLRSPDMSVMEILRSSGWADNFTAKFVQDPYNTQVITITSLHKEFLDESTPYDQKIAIGLKDLIRTMSEIVIGVSEDRFSIINMNLSDSVFFNEELDRFILNSLIPKIYAPIKPPVLNRFEKGEFDPSDFPYALELANLGRQLRSTDLFPSGSKFSEKIKRLSHRDVVEKILEGRTGVSYGFIAVVESPSYKGLREISRERWDALQEIKNINPDSVREDEGGRWYVATSVRGSRMYQQLPDIWMVTSRSGCDKTSLDPEKDVVRIGLVKGKLYLQTPRGMDLQRRDIRPSFDTYVILAQALSAALYTPEVIKDGMSIVHFHGYPDPKWFQRSEYVAGAGNPSMPCGTIEAALLNYSGVYEIANRNGEGAMNLLCLVESDHGVNIMGGDRGYLVERLQEGAEKNQIILGGKFLQPLKKSAANGDGIEIN